MVTKKQLKELNHSNLDDYTEAIKELYAANYSKVDFKIVENLINAMSKQQKKDAVEYCAFMIDSVSNDSYYDTLKLILKNI